MTPREIAHYRVDRLLGEGGMGCVYEAFDLKLERRVAIKVIRKEAADREMKERFWREARGAAGVAHPGICQVHEIGEDPAVGLYLVMELLKGETLALRISRGPLPLEQAIRITAEAARALEALHDHGLVHRDLKPSNIFVLTDGRIKILDFGLVRPVIRGDGSAETRPALTMEGALVGTPAYMAPEQINGDPIDARADLFSLAAIAWEMVAGRPAFGRQRVGETLAAVLKEEPPELPPGAASFDRVLRRSLAKSPSGRHESAAQMAHEMETLTFGARTPSLEATGPPALTLPMREVPSPARRLVVLPFRMLRPDPELDFLGFALADAVSLSLSSLGTVVVRSTAAAAPFATSPLPDLAEVARKLDVDAVLFGTILAAGGRCRVSAQLVEVAGRSVLCSTTSDAPSSDIFDLQDNLSRRIVETLRVPLGGGSHPSLGGDRPANPEAYELFLRANAAALNSADFSVARGLYKKCLETDPGFAPGWARLARLRRLEGKYNPEQQEEGFRAAEEALARALAINPDLGAAHFLKAGIDVDSGRAEAAVERLLSLSVRRPRDPDPWTGLVLAFRYLGLNEESLAAHRRAEAIDRDVPSSVVQTFIMLGRYQEGLASVRGEGTWSAAEAATCLWGLGRTEEGLVRLRRFLSLDPTGFVRSWAELTQALLADRKAEVIRLARSMSRFQDSEARAYIAAYSSLCGDVALALESAEASLALGYANVWYFEHSDFFNPVREESRFQHVVAAMRRRHEAAAARFGGAIS